MSDTAGGAAAHRAAAVPGAAAPVAGTIPVGIVPGIVLGIMFAVAPALAASPPPGAASCSGCHPAMADADTPVPRLAGRDAGAIITMMRAFRRGERPATVMDRIARGFSDDEIAAIAAFVAAQP